MKKSPFHHLICALFLSLFTISSFAADALYSVEYAPSSPIKDVSLKNTGLKIETYMYDKPTGYRDVSTDENQKFSLNHSSYFEVVSVAGEDKHHARCSGYGTPEHTKIIISCQPSNAKVE